MKYVIEKGCQLPLCAIKNNAFFDYLLKQPITNKNTLSFIQEGLENKSMEIKDIDFTIYEIKQDIFETYKILDEDANKEHILHRKIDEKTVAYNYCIDGCTNYLDENKKIMSFDNRQHIIDKLMTGEYKQTCIWSGNDE